MTAKADGPAKIETKDDGTVTGTFPRITFTAKDGNNAVLESVAGVRSVRTGTLDFDPLTGEVYAKLSVSRRDA